MGSTVLSYSVSGYELACLDVGEGVPLVLVHGSLCDYRYWQWQMRGLGQDYRLIVPSLRHYYPEAWDGRGGDFSTRQHVDDLLELLERLDEPVHLLGHSRGGSIGLRVALAAPERIRTLSLADPGGDFSEDVFRFAGLDAPVAPGARNQFREQALQLIERGDIERGLQLFVDTVSGQGVWARSSRHFREMAADNAMTLVGQVRDQPAPLGRQELVGLAVPVLLLSGELSPAPFPGIVEALRKNLPDAQVCVIAGASHGMNAMRPAAFNRAVLEFIGRY